MQHRTVPRSRFELNTAQGLKHYTVDEVSVEQGGPRHSTRPAVWPGSRLCQFENIQNIFGTEDSLKLSKAGHYARCGSDRLPK